MRGLRRLSMGGLGHDHRQPSGGLKTAADEEHKQKRAEVREARKAGQECCPRIVRRNKPVTFTEILADYMQYSERRKRSHDNDMAKADCFRKLFGDRLAIDVATKEVEDFAASFGQDHAIATVNHYLKFLKAVYNRAVRHARLTYNPVTPIRFTRENNARNRCLSPDEESRLLAALPARMRPLVLVALHTGMRLGELRALQWTDVDFDSSSIRVRRDKAGDGRWVAMNSVARAALVSAKRDQKILSSYVFASPEGKFLHNFGRYWRPAVAEAGIKDFRFHDCRHTFASRLAMSGVDMYTVQRAGGWKTPTMVQRYAHLSPDHMAAAVEKLASGGGNRH